MTEQTFALIDANNNVFNVIVADQAFVESLGALVDDPNVDTGDLPKGVRGYDVTDLEDRPTTDHKRTQDGKWVLQDGVQEARDLAAKNAADEEAKRLADEKQRANDNAFLETLRGKKSLTQDERDKMQLIALLRNE